MRLLPLAIVAMAILAGCSGATPVDGTDGGSGSSLIPEDWAERALPSGEGHDHFNAYQHQNLSTTNMRLLGWNPLVSQSYGITPGYHLCGDATDTGERRFAAVQGGGDVAFILVDVTDATKPEVIGELLMPTVSARDIALTPDGKYVVIGTSGAKQPERGPVGTDLRPTAIWRSPCNTQDLVLAGPEQNLPLANGVVLVSIQTPATPEIQSYFPLPALGAHSIYATKIGAQYYVLASVTNLLTATTYFQLFDILETEDSGTLVHVSYILEQPHQGNAPLINGHNDGVIVPHPINERVYGWFALWHQGLAIVDLSNPRLPTIVGRWTDNPPGNTALGTNDYGDIHEALPLNETWDGKHYTFVGQEILGRPSYAPSGYMKVLDTTDPTQPKAVAQWNLPVEVEWNASLQFSPHYISRHNYTIFMSHYHAGVWAIDVKDLSEPQLPAIGVFVPANISPKPAPTIRAYDWTPTVMENNALPNGDLVIWDSSSGVYLVNFDDHNKAPPTYWRG
jgi:hypothetical protein